MKWTKTMLAALAALLFLGRAGFAADAKAEAAAGLPEYVGADACLSCHSDHKDFEHNLHVKSMKNAKNIDFQKTCETCHGPGSLHVAAGGDRSNKDFYTVKNPSKMKAEEASAVCLQCHQGGDRMLWQGSVHEAKNISCVQCHSMHNAKVNGGESPLLSKASQADVCYQCHADKKAQIEKSAHMPIVEGKLGCASCHNPHGSNTDKLLVKGSVNDTCYACHQDKRGPFLFEHPPVRENCLNCHTPHGSHFDKLLVTKAPLLCQRCHISTRHPSSLYDTTALNTQSNRLENMACANCHVRLHGSNHPSGERFLR